MGEKGIYVFGVPLFGVILPYIGKRRVALNRDLSVVDTGQDDIIDESGFYYTEPWVFEWLGMGYGLCNSIVRRSDNDEPLMDDEAAA